jgi:hypothetical protein
MTSSAITYPYVQTEMFVWAFMKTYMHHASPHPWSRFSTSGHVGEHPCAAQRPMLIHSAPSDGCKINKQKNIPKTHKRDFSDIAKTMTQYR